MASFDGGELFFPNGTYLIDSMVITGRAKTVRGQEQGSITLTHGVTIKCRSTVTNFVTVGSGVDLKVKNILFDGNNKATNTVRYTNNQTDTVMEECFISGCVDNGCNLNLNPLGGNKQVSELKFYGIHVGGRNGGTGINNITIESDQSVVIAFYSLKCYGNNDTDVEYGIYSVQGTYTLYTPFFADIKTYDIHMGLGSVTVIDGRSESSEANSIYVGSTASGNITLINYVHGSTIAKTTYTAHSNFSGTATIIGGTYTNITNSSLTASTIIANVILYAGGVISDSDGAKTVQIKNGLVSALRKSSQIIAPTYSTSITLDAATGDYQFLTVTDGVAFTLNAPTNGDVGQELTIDIVNASGGAMGTITWNAVFKLAGAFTNPATGTRRIISFYFNGANWIETNRTAADGTV